MVSKPTHKATFYVVFEAEMYGSTTSPLVRKVKAARMTKQPGHISGGEVQARFEVEIPDNAFVRLMPTIEVELPDGFWSSAPITVVVPDPEQEEKPGG